MSRRLVLLIGGTLVFWLVVALPARWLGGGDLAVWYALVACLLCLVPAAATLIWVELAFQQHSDYQNLAIMGGGVLRMFFVAIVTNILYMQLPFFRLQDGFILWVCTFYLFTLALETILVTVGKGGSSPSGDLVKKTGPQG